MVKILVKKFDKKIKLPSYETLGSSGMDLLAYIKRNIIIYPGKVKIIPTGIALVIPKNFEIQIRPRSGLAIKKNISVLNTPGTIDSDYRGDIGVILINLSNENFIIQNGDRIAQLIVTCYSQILWDEQDQLDETSRGQGGFGSTGVKL